ncbi:MAG TPA: hypothetical protein DDW76_17235 [Cyanobacteria bacterium UBA11369]|nr:hypothetical protein [Cyanobacteria bacterium UBA11369]
MPDPFRQILFLVAQVSALTLQVYKQQRLTISPFLYNFTHKLGFLPECIVPAQFVCVAIVVDL